MSAWNANNIAQALLPLVGERGLPFLQSTP